ncbi:ATP-dependent RNA helicase DDX24-like [Mercenaria mercenaria]|uniref:ATP-dependent RNA helicase DDX24-like n=1 Tax=Mercenaria mercenaria TaxID=6596 RepID=UPI00234F211B|nr:ATP-dependent RNA helicase DDX24-like [Mercenaria mercenaria]
MAAFHVKAKKPWKNVDLQSAGISQKDLEGLISLQELTDYEIVDSTRKTGQKGGKDKLQVFKETNKLIATAGTDLQTNKKKDGKQQRKKDKREKNDGSSEKDRVLQRKGKKMQNKMLKQKKKLQNKTLLEGKLQYVEDLNEIMLTESTESNKQDSKQKTKRTGVKRKKTDKLDANEDLSAKKAKLETSAEQNTEAVIKHGKHFEPADKSLKGMEAWKDLFVPKEILWALKSQGFKEPTPIQSQILPSAIRDKMDVVGAAETGSGKTLAFGIPVLHFILQQKKQEADRLLQDVDEEEDESLSDIEDDSNEKDKEDLEEEDDSADSDNDSGNDDDDDNDDNDDNDDDAQTDEDNVGESNMVRDSVDDDDDEDIEENVEVDDGDDGKTETSGEVADKEVSLDEELEELQNDDIGCVKVIKDVDFSWLKEPEVKKQAATHPPALILEPTRELAIQVRNHLRAAAQYTDISVEAIVGGLAMPKQQRILKKCPDILVATPGRLWELVQQGEVYLSEIEKTCHLVVDEADRMTEKGHYEELAKLLEKMKRDPDRQNRHTYVFSATLTLIHSGPQRIVKKKKKKWDEKQKLTYLMRKMGLKPKPKVVDITRKVGTVETLTEARINCTKEEKDVYLYYFLKHYPGRTLVFTNSKDCIRRLVSIFTLLQCKPLPLHADMHQRQRLKNLDKFTGNPSSLLIASDVAARGLDIPNVQHVIHYQVPHTVENYVHRSGRTARASKEGLSIMMIGPDDVKNYRKVIRTLNKDEDLPLFPVEQNLVTEVKRRVNMVRQIETQEYRFKKSKRHNDWFRKAADEIGVDIEDEGLLDDLGDDVEQQRHSKYLKQMKSELAVLLKQPLLIGSSFTKYPTMSGKLVTPPAREEKGDALTRVKKNKKIHNVQPESTEGSQSKTKRRRERRRKTKLKKKDIDKTKNS